MIPFILLAALARLAELFGIFLRVDSGKDWQSKALGGDVAANDGYSGTSTATAATTMTDSGASWTVDQWKGHIVNCGNRYGVVLSNTATVLTIDKWYDPADPGGTAGSTPGATTVYNLGYGQYPAAWVAVTENADAAAAGDTALTGELAGSGWDRRFCAWAHTGGASTYTETATFTSADGTPRTLAKAAWFSSNRNATGSIMAFETLISPTAVMASGDQVTLTQTVTI